jgi:hypothetical protein
MCAQTHYTEKLNRKISELQAEYEALERRKEYELSALVKKLEAAQQRILELEFHNVSRDRR